MKYGLIRAALASLSAVQASAWLPRPADAGGFVVTLHHVRPKRHAPFDPNALLEITPDFLDCFLTRFRAKGWRFVSVEEITAPHATSDPRRIAVTLDDGYRNNLEHAWPVFRRHGVPFTIYVCPGFCDRTSELWWEALERIIGTAAAVAVPGDGSGELPAVTPEEKSSAFRQWTAWLTTVADETEQREAIRTLAGRHGLDLAGLARELVMDWDEVRTIAADPLCSIGAHTQTHPALARLPADAAFRQMSESADRIAGEIGARPISIAFPYGYPAAAGAREADLAEQAGFRASFTTQPGYLASGRRPHGAPRVSINGLFQDVRYLDVLLTPGVWSLRSRLRR